MIDRMQGNNSPCGVIRMRRKAVCIAGASRLRLSDVTLQTSKIQIGYPNKNKPRGGFLFREARIY
ncbi:hypothetical protein [Undibacterium aquatile]|uniref:Uncharacterized protein n=1 Tax=Undibacterium aquatile TaxID=1537398 RepID=A0ABR6XGK0_9BURK|nr:hypothetical protein [Undibacterium aquatile]MBC3811424.1 hypothetical protein [Undibacterium aquatile]